SAAVAESPNGGMSTMLRVSHLPLVHSALQSMTSAYTDVKGRYPLLGLMGGVAGVRIHSVSQVAMTRATPLLQSLEPQSGWSIVYKKPHVMFMSHMAWEKSSFTASQF
uniref:Uncharacterized protein n=1 Tax=Sphaeramia orbicularis TaxID=375764 RepID=A0A673AM40_9TELE